MTSLTSAAPPSAGGHVRFFRRHAPASLPENHTETPGNAQAAERSARTWLDRSVAQADGVRAATLWLLADVVAAIGFAVGLALAVGAIAAPANASPDGASTHGALPFLALALTSACARAACSSAAVRAGHRGGMIARRLWRKRLVDGLLTGGHGGVGERRTAGTMMQAAVDEVEALDGYVSRFVPARRAAAIGPLLVLAAIAAASPISALILVGTLVPFVAAMIFVGQASAAESRRQFLALSRLSSLFVDRLRALPIVLAFGARDRETQVLVEASNQVASRTMRVLRLAFLSSSALEFFAALCVALVAVYCGFNLLGLLPFHVPEKLTLGQSFAALALAPEFYAPMRRLAAAYHDRQAAMTAAGRLLPLTADAAAMPPATRAPAAEAALAPRAPLIQFEGVSITHVHAESAAVERLSFEIEPGKSLALVGPSGSGKTSVLRALLGLLPVSEGRILVDGVDVAQAGGVAGRCTYIGQNPLLIPGTLRENLLLATPQASESQLHQAIALAGLQPVVTARGLDGLLDPRGSGLSGGERRRIALVRALLSPAPLCLLDEPTAHLDAASETALTAVIQRLCRGRTALIVTHSAGLAAIADRVVELPGAAT